MATIILKTEEQLGLLVETIDICLRAHGLRVNTTATELAEVLKTPTSYDEATGERVYEMTEAVVRQFRAFLHLAVKAVGLEGGAALLIPLAELFPEVGPAVPTEQELQAEAQA